MSAARAWTAASDGVTVSVRLTPKGGGAPIERDHRRTYRDRPDLQAQFPDPVDAAGYRAWLAAEGLLSAA